MRFPQYLQRVRQFLNHGLPKQRPRKFQRPLALESLEDRSVPSILFEPGLSVTASDGGTSVIDNVHAELVFWGDGWNHGSGPDMRQSILNVVDRLVASPYLTGL